MQNHLGTSDLGLSLGWGGWPIGMLLASTLAGRIVERFGARRVVLAGGLIYWGAFSLAGLTTTVPELLAVMLLVGVGNGTLDVGWARMLGHVGQHALGHAQTLMATISVGGVLGAALGLLGVAFNLPTSWHLAGVGVTGIIVLTLTHRSLPDPHATDEHVTALTTRTSRPHITWTVRAVALVGCCSALPVGAGCLWSTIYLSRLGAPPAVASFGLFMLCVAEFLARILAGRYAHRQPFTDPILLVRTAAITAVIGLLLIVVVATPATAIVGFTLVVGGLAPVAPLVHVTAQRLLPKNRGVAAGLTVRYLFVTLALGPLVVGPLSTALGSAQTVTPLRVALGTLIALPLAILFLAKNLHEPADP